ncbi:MULTISPECIES: peroxiredoxin [Pseudomonas]|jgi:peroxiredoxin (alkyl hydroperoxide reductase subunit C)|uniref:Thioredoxin peroxidase n=9 Tax=Pseudomonas TaxID=286 RepID=A0A0P8XU43_PSEFL|nr:MULTISPECIES: peroxiredoxin C [Pseudomonas]AZO84403.1 alkyl hydroperoxide reductase [Stutzerimonas stutzeri]PNB76240.1 alkyl hydroperoxide reductase [Pseudomonas sp. GW456-E7]HWT68987.1 peroxiredoxin C [Pseudomonas sp.]AFY21598.1 peroxiredoxin [Pseudomonas sp. UW4]AWY41015.1 peroxiredoxin [Pseudomonas putida]
MSVLVGKQAPDFTVPAVLGNGEIVDSFTLSSAIKGKYGLVFFYPLDFTFVCPSELIALDNRMSEFKARNVEVVAVSIDSHFTHNAWRNTPVNNGGIGEVRYTMAADIKQEIMKAYDVQSADGVAFRGAFLIDDKGVVRSQIINDLPLGRNMEELLRLVDALQFHEEHGEVCPANWKKGDKGMNASPEGVAAYLTEHAAAL